MTSQTLPIELYFFPTPNGFKVSILLEELGVPYTMKMIDISKGDQFKPEFLAVSPNNKIPAIVDPEGPGGAPISVFESGAILKYLAAKFGKFYPTEIRAQVEVDQWLFWQMGGFGPILGQNHHFSIYAPEKVPYAIKRFQDETHRLYRVLDTQLQGQDFVAGDYSIADMSIIGWANGHERQGIDKNEFPNFSAWHARMNDRPAVARGIAVGKKEREQFNLASSKDTQSVLFNQR